MALILNQDTYSLIDLQYMTSLVQSLITFSAELWDCG